MAYTLWQTQELEVPDNRRAFVFDGWSHEPLVLDAAPPTTASPRTRDPMDERAADRTSCRKISLRPD